MAKVYYYTRDNFRGFQTVRIMQQIFAVTIILLSTSANAQWNSQNPTQTQLGARSVGSPTTVRGFIAKNGDSWFPNSSGTVELLNDVDYFPNGDLIAVGNNGTVLTNSGGTSVWNSQPAISLYSIKAVQIVNPTEIVLLDEIGQVYMSTDAGVSWTATNSIPPGLSPAEDVHFNTLQEGWVIGQGGTSLYHTNDKGTEHYEKHGYTEVYDKYIPETGKFELLEIGIWHGDSLRMWKEYNPDLNIFAIDIDPNIFKYVNVNDFNIYIGDQSDKEFLNSVVLKSGSLDFIIDDGSHNHQDIVTSFKFLFPKLKIGGYYFIEDLHAQQAQKYKVIADISQYNFINLGFRCDGKLWIIQKS